MQYVEHIRFTGAGRERHAQMGFQPCLVQMGGRGVQRDIDQFDHARRQRASLRRIARVVGVVRQKRGVGAQHGLGPWAPVAARGNEAGFDGVQVG
ncbi:hypothetical protein D3C71_1837460 [compost metagenome]